ncbi:DUF2617 family protein [Gordonia jacobaea]|uniref:DUF2617 family protein n=1 Tax=Gordonia jacobaea TaxID=122202 RepID=UPI003D764D93
MSPFTDLDVAFSDTRAGQLGFSLTAAQREPLAAADHTIGALTFSIRLLGASHQIVITDDAHELCETVACLPDITTALPDSFQADGYVFSSRVIECSSDAMADLLQQIESEVEGHARAGLPALLGRFPGNELAVTAVTADIDDDALIWRTWHTYPQAGEVVVTSSRIDRDALAVRS